MKLITVFLSPLKLSIIWIIICQMDIYVLQLVYILFILIILITLRQIASLFCALKRRHRDTNILWLYFNIKSKGKKKHYTAWNGCSCNSNQDSFYFLLSCCLLKGLPSNVPKKKSLFPYSFLKVTIHITWTGNSKNKILLSFIKTH